MMNFPQFRILQGADVLYAIHSPNLFSEWKRMGKYYSCNDIEAKQYPEMLRIQDMLQCAEGFESISKIEFEEKSNRWKQELLKVEF